tara:strand:- start:226 stop:435 length:210 start_codon:yes stop_codon:yes gene_type:complete
MEKLEMLDKLVIELRIDGVRDEAIFERVNSVLLRSNRKRETKKEGVKKYRKKPVCRPVLFVSDSSCDEM